jgi:hypothetical protein
MTRVAHSLASTLMLIWIAVALAIGVAWARSYGRSDTITAFGPGGRPMLLAMARGQLFVLASTTPIGGVPCGSIRWRAMSLAAEQGKTDQFRDDAQHHWKRLGFIAGIGTSLWGAPTGYYAFAGAPAWLIWPLTIVVPARWTGRQFRRHRRVRRGECLNCGYDLRASTDRCPECGQPIQT